MAVSNAKPNSNNEATPKTVMPAYSSDTKPNACSYTVQSGDTLWSIAQKVFGNGAAYPLIIEKNKEKYPNIASSLSIGQELSFGCENATEETTVKGVADTKDDNSANGPEINQPSSSDSGFKWWNPMMWF